MAASTAAINRGCSPMTYIEENLDEDREKTRQRKERLLKEQKTKSPFLVGTIDEVNRRISKLDRKLQNYTALIVESRSSDNTDASTAASTARTERSNEYEKRVYENKEVNKFAGIYSIKSTFLQKPSERAKNISKISMNPSKTSVKKDSGKPRFVELHQFPGYEQNELTPLPHDTCVLDILTKVAKSQVNLQSKPHYRPEFERLYYSPMSQAVLQDTFWYIFLEKWQPSKNYQYKLFNRISHNYVKLLTYARHPTYRDRFLSDYPTLLAQGVYCAFCETFPDSYRQFNDEFKEDLTALVFEWVAGVKPGPRSWHKWNLEALEPPNIKLREERMNQNSNKSSKKSSILNFDFLDPAGSTYTGSQSTLNQAESQSSMSSTTGKKFGRRGTRRASAAQQEKNGSKSTGRLLAEVAEANDSESNIKSKSQRSKAKVQMPPGIKETDEPLTPIDEFDEDGIGLGSPLGKHGKSNDFMKSYADMMERHSFYNKESHPVGKGPTFHRSVFDMCGQSPLVSHFLRMKNLSQEAGMSVLVQRTQVEHLPPIGQQTYKQLMTDTYKNMRESKRKHNDFMDKNILENKKFVYQQKTFREEYKRKEAMLMSKPGEIKRLSDIIMLELKKDPDSVAAGAAQAIESALEAQDKED